jgi:hypothetical protein
MTPDEQADLDARRGTTEDIVNLVEMYGQLDTAAKGELLTCAVELMAEQRMRRQKKAHGEECDANDWLTRVAEGTFPRGDDGARLLQRAADVNCEGLDAVFGDGLLSVVLSPSEQERANGEGLYVGYMNVWGDTSPSLNLPAPDEFFGIKELNRDYEKYEYAETEREWQASIYSQCIDELSGMVSCWRRDFFKAILGK